MGQSLEGKMKMGMNQANLGKTRKTPSSRKRKGSLKLKGKKATKTPGFLQSLTDQFHQVAPLEWVPTPYQAQIKAAKPLHFAVLRKKKSNTSLH